ncbi:MAG: DUF1254 domain-containing protein [Candidatus Obscuribacterales bacterium]|nr:DUF1254 domain-containing protein [Candidatus Obscuribacterales bacterium]
MKKYIRAAVLLTLIATMSQPSGFSQNSKYKMTTPIPEGIEAPEKINSGRLGPLHLKDGFPDTETTSKLFDNLDFQRAVQSYLLGLPGVSLVAMKKALAELGPPNESVAIFEDLMDSRSLFLTANDNTPYTLIWIDLSKGPIVLEAPPKVLGTMDDYWFHWVTDIGVTGPDQGQGGKYLLLPPDYKGSIPEGYHLVRPRTNNNLVFWRSFLVNGDPKPGVELIKKHTRIYPLTGGNPELSPKFVNVSAKQFNTIAPADYAFWKDLAELINQESAAALDPVTMGFFASIGISKGSGFQPDERMRKILTEAAAVADASVRALTYRSRDTRRNYYPNSAWCKAFVGGYKFEEPAGVLNLDAYSSFFFYATGITPAMEQKMVGKGSQYACAFVDSKKEALDGGKQYKLHLPPNIPVKDFWSVLVYDNQTRSMLQSDQKFPALSSQSKELAFNPDGSVDIFFGPKAPPGKENNWIQTIPNKGWNTILRLYGPLESWFDMSWKPGEIEEVK